MFSKQLLLAVVLLLPAVMVTAAEEGAPWQSAKGLFTVTYESELNPLVINQIHNWVLQITDAEGRPVENAEVVVTGGMPEHNHGLATAPVIEEQESGRYLLQGLRFHMMGYWELALDIRHQGSNDKVTITLDL